MVGTVGRLLLPLSSLSCRRCVSHVQSPCRSLCSCAQTWKSEQQRESPQIMSVGRTVFVLYAKEYRDENLRVLYQVLSAICPAYLIA